MSVFGDGPFEGLLFGLVGDLLDFFLQGFLVDQVIVFHQLHIVVKFQYERHAGRDIQGSDFLIGNLFQMLECRLL